MNQLNIYELKSFFIEHKKWIDSLGKEGKKLDLDDIDLSLNSIEGELYEQASITGCLFDNRKIKDVSFYLSNLCSSSFGGCDLEEVDFTKADLSYATFSNAVIKNVNMNKCDCIETNFRNSKLSGVKFTGALLDTVDLRNAILQDVDLSYSSFEAVLVKGISLKNVVGFESIPGISINVGDESDSQILQGNDAIKWLKDNME